MYWDVKNVKPLPDYCLYVEIEDGRKGIFDVKPYIDHGVFRELRNVHYFNQVGILFGAVTWPNEQDIALKHCLLKWFQWNQSRLVREGSADESSASFAIDAFYRV